MLVETVGEPTDRAISNMKFLIASKRILNGVERHLDIQNNTMKLRKELVDYGITRKVKDLASP